MLKKQLFIHWNACRFVVTRFMIDDTYTIVGFALNVTGMLNSVVAVIHFTNSHTYMVHFISIYAPSIGSSFMKSNSIDLQAIFTSTITIFAIGGLLNIFMRLTQLVLNCIVSLHGDINHITHLFMGIVGELLICK